MTTNLLLIDDDLDYSEVTAYALRRAGFEVVVATAATQARAGLSEKSVDLVLLNPLLRDASGLELCRLATSTWGVPVVALSTSRKEEDVLDAFSAGADDYVTKPYSMKQLVARLEAIHRRSAVKPMDRNPRLLTIGSVSIDQDAFTVTVGDHPIHLTRQEFLLLQILASNAGKVVPHHRLVEYAWDDIAQTDTGLVKTLLSRVRRKLQDAGCSGVLITAIPRIGYKLEERSVKANEPAQDDIPDYLRDSSRTERSFGEDTPARIPNGAQAEAAHILSGSGVHSLSAELVGRMEETLAMLKTYRASMTVRDDLAG